MKSYYLILGVAFCIFLPLPFLIPHISQIPIIDAVFIYHAIVSTAEDGIPKSPSGKIGAWHVPTYLYISALGVKLFGPSLEVIRAVGIIFFYLTALLVALVVSSLAPSRGTFWGLCAAGVYLCYPPALQGALLFDFDTTLVPFSIIALIGYLARRTPPLGIKQWLIVGGLFGFSFLAKENHPPILFAGIIIYLLMRRSSPKDFLSTLTSLLGGLLAGLIIYAIFSHLVGWPFGWPFSHGKIHLGEYLREPFSKEKFLLRLRFLAGFISWFTPVASIIGFTIAASSLRKIFLAKYKDSVNGFDLLVMVWVLYFLVATCVCGFSWWFPRYYSAMVPIFITALMVWASRNIDPGKVPAPYLFIPGIILAGFLIQILVIGDPIKTFIYDAKMAFLKGLSLRLLIFRWVLQSVVALFLLVVISFILRLFIKDITVRAIISAIGPALTAGLGIGILALQIGYEQTTYGYATRGTKACIKRLNRFLKPGEFVMAPHELVYFTRSKKVFAFEPDWNDVEGIYKKWATDPACRAIVFSLARNSSNQFRRLKNHKRLSELLKKDFFFEKIGDYWVWIRRS